MTEQERVEEVRKVIADKLASWFGHPLGYNNDFFYEKADELLRIIKAEAFIRKEGFDEGIKRATDACNDTFDSLLEGAKKQERKAIQDLYQTKEGDIVIPKDDWENRGKL